MKYMFLSEFRILIYQQFESEFLVLVFQDSMLLKHFSRIKRIKRMEIKRHLTWYLSTVFYGGKCKLTSLV